MNTEQGGSDVLTKEDFEALEKGQEEILDGLYKKVRDSDQAKEWLNTTLGQAFRKFLAADKMRAMKVCSTEVDPDKRREAQLDYGVVCKLEVIFGSIISDGVEALNELNQHNTGDTDGN
ncbi:MAG: hypothetical protein MJK15_00825 [Colwellia sp.]|nr:hypothetical protein [Colwellia sp.]